MAKEPEVTKPTRRKAISSPSIVKLHRAYKSHIIDCVHNLEPILPLDEFYKRMRRGNHIPASRTYENYLTLLSQKGIEEK